VVTNHKKQRIKMLSITKLEKCPHCSSENIVKNGFTKGGNQRVLCHTCSKSRVLHRKSEQDVDIKSVRRSFLERMSLCGVSRVFLISYYRVYKELNICFLLLPNFKTQVADKQEDNDVLEFDELCGFCQSKKNKQWVWAALSRKTRQVVAYVIGDRSEKTFRRLIRKIPIEYLKSKSFSDYWKSYAILKAKGNHQQVGKESGQTNHIERYWATLRARITRYVRKSLSFSRNLRYHHLVTKLFIVDYNQNCSSTLF
jgi:insertion element IS1 protein InsB